MGIDNFYQYEARLSDKLSTIEIVPLLNNANDIHVDLPSLTYAAITRATKYDIDHPFAATPRLNDLPRMIANDMDRIFGPSARTTILFHIDGADCNEKQRARKIRGERITNAATAANNILPSINQSIKPPSKSKEAEFKKHALKTFRFDPSLKTWLATSLITLGVNVHQCPFEADVCIAATLAASTSQGERIAVSADSDFEIYAGIPTVLRPLDRRCTTWTRYDKDRVLGDFGFTHPEQMVLFGVVNRNDYDGNLPNQGLARNRAVIAGLPSSTSAPRPTLFDSLLKEYLTVNGAGGASFTNSVQVFNNLQQTPLVGPPAPVHPNQEYVDLFQRARGIAHWRNAYPRTRSTSTSTSSGLTGQVAIAGAAVSRKPNLYRPKLGRGMPAGLRVKVFRFDQANPIVPPLATEDDWSGEKAAAPGNLTPLAKPKRKPKPKTAAQKRKDEERAKKAQKKKEEEKKKKEEDKKKKKVKDMAPSAAPSAKGVPRVLKESTRLFHKLRGKYRTIALPLGTVRTNLIRNLAGSGLQQAQAEQVQARIEQSVVMPGFVFGLARRLYHGNSEIPKGEEASDAALAAYHAFKLFQQEAGKVLTPLKMSYPFYIGGSALDLAVLPVFTAIRSHYENATFLGVDADPNSSVIRKFFGLNAKENRYKDFPKAKFSPSSITLSEDGLCHLLYGNTPSENLLKAVMQPHTTEVKKLPTRSKATSGGPFLDHTTGILVRTLFGVGQHQGVLLISEEHNKDSRVLRPAFHTDGLTITLLAHNLAMPKKKNKTDDDGAGGDGGGDVPKGGDIKGKGVMRDVEGPGASQRSLRTRRATVLSSSAGSDEDEDHAQELRTAIRASRATFQRAQEASMQESAGGASSSSVGASRYRGARLGGVFKSVVVPPVTAMEKDRVLATMTTTVVMTMTATITTMKMTRKNDGSEAEWGLLELPADFEDEEDINNLDQFFLKDAEEAFKNMSRSSTSYPNRNTRPIGIDPGINIAAEAVMIDPANPGKMEARAVRVIRKVLNKPTKYFAQRLQRRKRDMGIDIVESKIPPFSRTTLREYLKFLLEPDGPLNADSASVTLAPPPLPPPTVPHSGGSSSARVRVRQAPAPQASARRATRHQRGNTRLDMLNRFYSEEPFLPTSRAEAGGRQQSPRHWFLRNRWDAKKAKGGMMDIAIDAIFQLGGGTSHLKQRNDANANFVLGIGSGQFRGRQQYSLHGPFLRRLVSKAKGLGILVVKVKEEYTSKKCPRPNCSQDLDHIRKDRSAWCSKCQMYFDRDVVGGENICRILAEHMKGRPRPMKFKKPTGGGSRGAPPGGSTGVQSSSSGSSHSGFSTPGSSSSDGSSEDDDEGAQPQSFPLF
ncbi:hypothetical protein EC968_001075 [Mortierella alpina]|nr:hypothetical protein EC968_001075 [Mortierella alpina]